MEKKKNKMGEKGHGSWQELNAHLYAQVTDSPGQGFPGMGWEDSWTMSVFTDQKMHKR